LAQKNGKSSSHIVFITAHEEYAIKAFRFSALDFLLKPVDPEELEKVIEKIKSTLEKNDNYAHIDLLLENIRKKVDNFKRIALSTSDGIHLLEVSDIIRCESEDNYTKFYIKNGKPILISKTLKEYEELLAEHGFERIHQSHLINLSCLKSYIKKDGGYVIMADNSKLPISQRKKERLHELLKMI
ncbi:MAG: DNA-binding response regulator, partial [Flavobacterium johnsoniae]